MLKKIIMIILTALLFIGCDNEIHGKEKKSSLQTEPEGETTDKTNNKTRQQVQNLNYTDSEQIIYNPDMGFYTAIDICVEENGIRNKTEVLEEIKAEAVGYSGSYNSDAKFNLLHLKFDISAFSDNAIRKITKNENTGKVTTGKTQALTKSALDDIEEVLHAVEVAGKTSIVRFSYDYQYQGQKKYADNGNNEIRDNLVWVKKDENGNDLYKLYENKWGNTEYADVEPLSEDFNTVLSHITAISPLLIANQKSITAIECGMIGPYGEMHSTSLAGEKDGLEDGYIIEIMNKFLTELKDTDIPFLVRQPKFIRNYLSAKGNTYKSKLGMYNDGYLGSKTDLGTFADGGSVRSSEINYLEPFTSKTPYGGEMCHDYGDSDNPALWRTSFLESSIDEMYKVHLSFLNIAWNDTVLAWADSKDGKYGGINENNKVKNERFFQYLIKHMGYRYILTESVFETSDDGGPLEIRLNFENKGFANIPYHRKKILILYFVKDENPKLTKTLPNMVFDGNSKVITIDTSLLASGTYTVYLKVSDEDGAYPIRFANNLWEPTLMANKIGQFTK